MRYLIGFILFLSSCQATERTSLPEELSDRLFSPCVVIQDFMIERRKITEARYTRENSPRIYVEPTSSYKYIASEPIWLSMWPLSAAKEPASAQTTIQHMTMSLDYMRKRMRVPPDTPTIEAYKIAQTQDFSLSNCYFPSGIYMGPKALAEIKRRAALNIELRRAEFAIPRKKWTERNNAGSKTLDDEHYKVILADLVTRRQPYVSYKFSRVGVSRETHQAFFYYETYCGMLCASGNYVLMELHDGYWRRLASHMVWIS